MYKKAWPYVLHAAPAVTPITTTEARAQLKLGTDADTALDAELTRYINAAVATAEKYVKREFITRTFKTYRDRFYGDIILRRNPLQTTGLGVQYYLNGALVTVSSALYYVTIEPDGYSRICLVDGKTWPDDGDVRQQQVVITFQAGYGDAGASVPAPLREGLLAHVSQLWTHRGDNDFAGNAGNMMDGSAKIPGSARMFYDKYRILDID